MTSQLKIAVLPGDGIGREVMDAALPVFDTLGVPVELRFGEIGWECWRREGNPGPEATWRLIEETDTTLLGAITSKPLAEAEAELPAHLRGKNHPFVSPVIQLRQKLGLFANVRPIWSLGRPLKPFRAVVLRENTEGLYAGLDFQPAPDALVSLSGKKSGADMAVSLRLLTREGLERLFHFAFRYAKEHGYPSVTWADKPNVLRKSGHFCRQVLAQVAAEYPGIPWDIQNVDAVGQWLVTHPERYGVVVAENMFGDILSDVAAGVMGGLGVAPSANVGERKTYFEPVHGSAPGHAGKNRVNPSAMFLTIGLLLEQFGYRKEGAQIRRAVAQVIHEGRAVTYDLKGTAGTREMAAAILQAVQAPAERKTVGLLATGNELVGGDALNTTSQRMAGAARERHRGRRAPHGGGRAA